MPGFGGGFGNQMGGAGPAGGAMTDPNSGAGFNLASGGMHMGGMPLQRDKWGLNAGQGQIDQIQQSLQQAQDQCARGSGSACMLAQQLQQQLQQAQGQQQGNVGMAQMGAQGLGSAGGGYRGRGTDPNMMGAAMLGTQFGMGGGGLAGGGY